MTGPTIKTPRKRFPSDDRDGDRRLKAGHTFCDVGPPADDPDFRPRAIVANPEEKMAAALCGRDFGPLPLPGPIVIEVEGWRVLLLSDPVTWLVQSKHSGAWQDQGLFRARSMLEWSLRGILTAKAAAALLAALPERVDRPVERVRRPGKRELARLAKEERAVIQRRVAVDSAAAAERLALMRKVAAERMARAAAQEPAPKRLMLGQPLGHGRERGQKSAENR